VASHNPHITFPPLTAGARACLILILSLVMRPLRCSFLILKAKARKSLLCFETMLHQGAALFGHSLSFHIPVSDLKLLDIPIVDDGAPPVHP
jgi:hypothetical protein